MRQIKYTTKLLVEKNKNRTSGLVDLTTLADGEIGVFDLAGNLLNNTTVLAQDKVRIVSGGTTAGYDQGLGLVIDRNGVLQFSAKDFSAQTVGLTYVGYNCTSGSLDVINDNDYKVFIQDKDSPTYGTTGYTTLGYYASDSSATQQEVADGLVLSLVQNSFNLIAKPFKAELVNSASAAATTDTVTLTNGSKTVPVATNIAAAASVGDYIRVGSQTTGTTVTSYPVYKIAGISGTTLTLTVPFQGTSGSVAIYRLVAATAQAGDWGLRFTGLVQPFASDNTAASQEFYVARWKTSLGGFTNTVVTESAFANKGQGEPAEIAVLERSLLGEQGFGPHNTWPPAVFPNNTNINATGYGTLNLKFNLTSGPNLISTSKSQNELIIACEKSSPLVAGNAGFKTDVIGTTDSVVDVLNAWLGTSVTF